MRLFVGLLEVAVELGAAGFSMEVFVSTFVAPGTEAFDESIFIRVSFVFFKHTADADSV